ncbi:lysis protein [Enterobacter hormaechei]|uniref:lysis protein n=1 Tax=Enterobacter hormaechei TaxID=158836 RepID=UPI0018D1EADD|nr:lysis protein [Enterobacter hormaechei]QPO46961.1 lysis protein [Enterobacter hormaechei]QPO52228.1 lysis protein [Enterobacter hormaechei]QPO71000.1 lysis protein [Enterobacter hormaechei]QPO75838.1 lysis protein [Enterobacter hormaechei]QPO81691.1 lysis protein [Enterobacter hormaechei]
MNISLKSLIVPGVILLLALASWLSYSSYKGEKKRADDAEQSLSLANATITDMQTRQRDVAALDAKYTGELADAKETIERLHSDVIAGRKRLQLNANCPANGATGTGSLGDATSPRPTDSAERDYFTLRERIVTVTKQVGYLQDYIKDQCLK